VPADRARPCPASPPLHAPCAADWRLKKEKNVVPTFLKIAKFWKTLTKIVNETNISLKVDKNVVQHLKKCCDILQNVEKNS
jgi:hypothetical protein